MERLHDARLQGDPRRQEQDGQELPLQHRQHAVLALAAEVDDGGVPSRAAIARCPEHDEAIGPLLPCRGL